MDETPGIVSQLGGAIFGTVSSLGAFASRHRKKLLVTGVAMGGAYYAYTKARGALENLPTSTAALQKQLHDQMKLATLLDSNMKIIEKHVQGMLPPLRASLKELYDVESIKEKLRSKELSGKETLKLWDDMKLLCFTRTLTAMYIVCYTDLYTNMCVALISRMREETEQLSTEDQMKILATADILHDAPRVRDVGELVKSVVEPIVMEYELKRVMDQEAVIKLIAKIRLRLESLEGSPMDLVRNTVCGATGRQRDPVLAKAMADMEHFVNTQEYASIVASCLDSCYNKLIKDLAESLMENGKARGVDTTSPTWPLAKILPCIFSRIHVVLADKDNAYIHEMHDLRILQDFTTSLLKSTHTALKTPPAI